MTDYLEYCKISLLISTPVFQLYDNLTLLGLWSLYW